jgi:hypothetical protein
MDESVIASVEKALPEHPALYEGLHGRSGHGVAPWEACFDVLPSFREVQLPKRTHRFALIVLFGGNPQLFQFLLLQPSRSKMPDCSEITKCSSKSCISRLPDVALVGDVVKTARQPNSHTPGWSNFARGRGTSNGSSERR